MENNAIVKDLHNTLLFKNHRWYSVAKIENLIKKIECGL